MRRAMRAVVSGAGGVTLFASLAVAQIPLPSSKPADGATLFKQQCATCHTTNLSDSARQGPTLFRIVGRPAGKAEGFRYSAGFEKIGFVWNETKLDAYLTNPQEVVPGSVMPYRQAKPETRAAIIEYLKELN